MMKKIWSVLSFLIIIGGFIPPTQTCAKPRRPPFHRKGKLGGTSLSQAPTANTTKQDPFAVNFTEVTTSFFKHPRTYSISSFSDATLGYKDGVSFYSEGEAIFTVRSNGFSYKLKDEPKVTFTITTRMKNIPVLTSRGETEMPVYMTGNNTGVRAVQFEDGHVIVYFYTEHTTENFFTLSYFINLK